MITSKVTKNKHAKSYTSVYIKSAVVCKGHKQIHHKDKCLKNRLTYQIIW